MHVRIPKLIIQPLVENAILHGAGNKIGDCLVTITVEQVNTNRIRISVQDDGPGMDQERVHQIVQAMKTSGVTSTKGKGIAISNVNKRLKLYYNENLYSELLIESEPTKGTRISFEIPIGGE